MTTLAAAQAGDPPAFEQLVAGHRRELHVRGYRMPGSLDDADDALQETSREVLVITLVAATVL